MDPLVCTADCISFLTQCIVAFLPFCLYMTFLPFMSLPFAFPTTLDWQALLLGEFCLNQAVSAMASQHIQNYGKVLCCLISLCFSGLLKGLLSYDMHKPHSTLQLMQLNDFACQFSAFDLLAWPVASPSCTAGCRH